MKKSSDPGFSSYELQVLNEIALHLVSPSLVAKFLATAGKPIDKLLSAGRTSSVSMVRKVTDVVDKGIEKGMKKAVWGANHLSSDEGILKEYRLIGDNFLSIAEVGSASMESMDSVADSFDFSNAVMVGVEGAVLGAATTLCEGIPFAQVLIPTVVAADVAASMTLLSRHVCQIAASYGFSSRIPTNVPHILAAMAPHHNASPQDGFFSMKATVTAAIREAGQHISGKTSAGLGEKLAEKEMPALVKLINQVAERLGIVVTEKELGMLVPVAGAVLNGGLNIAFQQMGHTTAKDYFRVQVLNGRHGEKHVENEIQKRIRQSHTS